MLKVFFHVVVFAKFPSCEASNLCLAHSASNEWVFPNLENGKPFKVRQHYMKRICKQAGVKPFGLHAIRHLTGQYFGSRGFPIVTIQRILGHKQLTTTERYIRGLEPVKPALEILSNRDLRPKVPTTIQISQKQKSEVM